jgi:hypothetical protein
MTLFDLADRQVADTSRQAYQEQILPTLTTREIAVFLALCDYLDATGREDVTGGELTEWMVARRLARDVNGVRPRLTGLTDKGWLLSLSKRRCRAYGSSAHPYAPAVPRAAVERRTR